MGGGSNNNNNGNSNTAVTTKCGVYEQVIFLIALIAGTACSICSKTMMQLHGTGITDDTEIFTKPIFQTFGMFVGMTFGLIMHGIVVVFKLPFPGYEQWNGSTTTTTDETKKLLLDNNNKTYQATTTTTDIEKQQQQKSGAASPAPAVELAPPTPVWMYFFLAIPSIFDLAATALCMMGLRYLDVSIYQLLRGSGIIFVALMKQHVLGDRLYKFQWMGVLFNVISVGLVGSTAILNSANYDEMNTEVDASPSATKYGGGEALLGVLLVMCGAFVQALQFVFEEKVMNMDEASAPPLLLIGMEGLWGTILCLLIIYPLVYYLPGDDHGSYEDPFNTWHMISHSNTIQWAFLVYFFAIFSYNMFAILVTFSLNSVWHAILDNFRPITVWGFDMFIFYGVASLGGQFGEPWTPYSWVQLLGMCVLLYGTSVYNAPNAGSIKLKGQWYALGVNLGYEYQEIEMEMQEEEMQQEWEERRQEFGKRRASSLLAEHTPFVSVHTQALRGMGSPKI